MTLAVEVLGTTFQNPVLLAAGTCGFGEEVAGVVDLEALGGFVTKSVTVEPRPGNPAPRVAEFPGGMLNSIGLANPGVEGVRREKLPWIRDHVRRARVLVSLAGHTPEEYETLVDALDGEEGFVAFELNLSCPNDRRKEGLPFALDPDALRDVVSRCRARTDRPLAVKLAPNDPTPAATARAAAEAGADALTLVNTLPGRTLLAGGAPSLGAGSGGVSGPALLPVGLRTVTEARAVVDLPILGVGGILSPADAGAYLRAGADLVQMGTASFADPRAAERVVRGLGGWARRTGWSGGPPRGADARGRRDPSGEGPAASAPPSGSSAPARSAADAADDPEPAEARWPR